MIGLGHFNPCTYLRYILNHHPHQQLHWIFRILLKNIANILQDPKTLIFFHIPILKKKHQIIIRLQPPRTYLMFLLRLYSCGKLVKQMQLTIMTAPRKALIIVLSVNFLQLIPFRVVRITRKIRSLRQIILQLPTRPSLHHLNQHQETIFKVVELPKNVGRSVEISSWYSWKGTNIHWFCFHDWLCET